MPKSLALAVSLVLAVLAVLGLNRAWSARDAAEQADSVPVAAAARDLPAGKVLGPEDVTLQTRPERYADPNLVRDAEGARALVDRPLRYARRAGEPISWTDVESRSRALSERIPLGERAVTIPVDEVSGVGGHLRPNDRVDILALLPGAPGDDDEPAPPTCRVLAGNVTVLRAGEDGSEGGGYATVTVAVSAEEAQVLALAAHEGDLVLLLRNPQDLDPAREATIDLAAATAAGSLDARGQERQERIRIYRGGESQ